MSLDRAMDELIRLRNSPSRFYSRIQDAISLCPEIELKWYQSKYTLPNIICDLNDNEIVYLKEVDLVTTVEYAKIVLDIYYTDKVIEDRYRKLISTPYNYEPVLRPVPYVPPKKINYVWHDQCDPASYERKT